MVEHIHKGIIAGFCTGSPDTYILRLRPGYPTDDRSQRHDGTCGSPGALYSPAQAGAGRRRLL